MNEFKFACPVCGQHITADSHSAGSQLECPTCFRKIVVPQAPSSADPKFILAAAEANKPRPPQTAVTADPAGGRNRTPAPMGLALLLVLACIAGAALFLLRGKIFGSSDEATPSNAEDAAAEVGPIATNRLAWTLNLTNAAYPEGIVAGRIRGRDFVCERATLQGGTLTLRHGRSGTTDLGVTIYFYARQPEALAGRTVTLTPENTGAPRLVLRWKENGQPVTATFMNGYALKLQFGEIGPGGLPGKIYLCTPDQYESCVAGTFNAEIRRSSSSKQRSPQPPQQKR